MSRYDYYQYFQESKPIETDEGIKARSKRGKFVENWWATRWIKALEKVTNAGRLRRGRTYARKGQVLSIEETSTGVRGRVQGSQSRPYRVTIELKRLSEAQWEQVLAALSGQALFSAQLLAGEMPQEIEDVFTAAGVSLFPEKSDELITNCSCPDYANPCKHLAAVHYILGEQFDQDPFLLFRLRGRTQAQIMAALQEQRTDGPADAEDDWDDVGWDAEAETPLEERLTDFWEMGQPLRQFSTKIRPPVAPLAVLRRLGKPTFLSDDMVDFLEAAYQTISEQAITAAYREDLTATEQGDD